MYILCACLRVELLFVVLYNMYMNMYMNIMVMKNKDNKESEDASLCS